MLWVTALLESPGNITCEAIFNLPGKVLVYVGNRVPSPYYVVQGGSNLESLAKDEVPECDRSNKTY